MSVHMNSYARDAPHVTCPLCLEANIPRQRIERHLARHLEELALFAVPHDSAEDDVSSDESRFGIDEALSDSDSEKGEGLDDIFIGPGQERIPEDSILIHSIESDTRPWTRREDAILLCSVQESQWANNDYSISWDSITLPTDRSRLERERRFSELARSPLYAKWKLRASKIWEKISNEAARDSGKQQNPPWDKSSDAHLFLSTLQNPESKDDWLDQDPLPPSHPRRSAEDSVKRYESLQGLTSRTDTLFIWNISPSTTLQSLGTLLSKHHSVRRLYVPYDASIRERKSFGYALYGSSKDAQMAMEKLRNPVLDGHDLRFDFAVDFPHDVIPASSTSETCWEPPKKARSRNSVDETMKDPSDFMAALQKNIDNPDHVVQLNGPDHTDEVEGSPVEGSSDTILNEPAKKSEREAQEVANQPLKGLENAQKVSINVDRECGVAIADTAVCRNCLHCETHSSAEKRAVRGRSASFEQLFQQHESERQNEAPRAANSPSDAPANQPTSSDTAETKSGDPMTKKITFELLPYEELIKVLITASDSTESIIAKIKNAHGIHDSKTFIFRDLNGGSFNPNYPNLIDNTTVTVRVFDLSLRETIKFKDAVGRSFQFPFHLCAKWQGMEDLIHRAFFHVEDIGRHVVEGHYDLIGPNGDVILPQVWDTVIEPGWTITMQMWPLPGRSPSPDLPPPNEQDIGTVEKPTTQEPRKASEMEAVTVNESDVDLDKQCGVILADGTPCPRSLYCVRHDEHAKRALPGRSMPIDQLLSLKQSRSIPSEDPLLNGSEMKYHEKNLPPNKPWTEITRDLVSAAALEDSNLPFEEAGDYYYVLRHLEHDNVEGLVNKTHDLKKNTGDE